MAMLTTAKGLPLTYNKDLQEDKEGFFDAIDTIKFTLAVYRDMILTMTVNENKMAEAVSKDFSNATDLADYLVRKGLPFRNAHEVCGKCVAYAILNIKCLGEISIEEYKQFSELIAEDLYEALKPYNCVEARKSYGGPAFSENEKQFTLGEEILAKQEAKLSELQANL